MVQWMWYNYQDIKDQEEKITDARDMIEYHASFIEPEIVGRVIEGRNKNVRKDILAGTTNDADFNESIKRMFGRDPGIAKNTNEQQVHKLDNVFKRITEYQEQQAANKQTATPFNYRYWSDVNLE